MKKCPYCDFNSHELKNSLEEKRYISALLQDLDQDLPKIWGRKIISIFMGGGTPSLFSPASIDELLAGIRARIPVSPNAEISMEANPGTIENHNIKGYRSAGVNRISFGVQSFNDIHLKALGRIHNSYSAVEAIKKAKEANFEKINIDLMYALPNQTLAEAYQDIQTAIEFEPTHISYYHLTIEPNTEFYLNKPILPDENSAWSISEQGKNILSMYGYENYEVSAYAKKAFRCAHNINYWRFGDYLGIGAGAHAKITDAALQNVTRYWKVKHPKNYLNASEDASFISGQKMLEEKELILEFLMNALRLREGVSFDTFTNNTGINITKLRNQLTKPIQQNLIIWDEDKRWFKTSDQGNRFLDTILTEFL